MDKDTYLTINEACKMLKISKPTLYKLGKIGKIKFIKIGKSTRILRQQIVDEFK